MEPIEVQSKNPKKFELNIGPEMPGEWNPLKSKSPTLKRFKQNTGPKILGGRNPIRSEQCTRPEIPDGRNL